MTGVYEAPEYYELAFSWRDIPAEVDVFEESIRRYSRIPVRRMLEPACGSSPHLAELARRGYKYTGVDISGRMLEYARRKARAGKIAAEFVCADISDFALRRRADFAYIMLGSLYVASAEKLALHLDSVSAALNKGGLYFLDWCVQFGRPGGKKQSWEAARGGCKIRAVYSAEAAGKSARTVRETLRLEVDDCGEKKTFVGRSVKKTVYPQEFLDLIGGRDDFEFMGWWNNWNLDEPLPGPEKIVRPVTIIRRV